MTIYLRAWFNILDLKYLLQFRDDDLPPLSYGPNHTLIVKTLNNSFGDLPFMTHSDEVTTEKSGNILSILGILAAIIMVVDCNVFQIALKKPHNNNEKTPWLYWKTIQFTL